MLVEDTRRLMITKLRYKPRKNLRFDKGPVPRRRG